MYKILYYFRNGLRYNGSHKLVLAFPDFQALSILLRSFLLMLFVTMLVYLSPSNSAHFSKQVSQIPRGYSVKATFFSGRFLQQVLCQMISVREHIRKLSRD